MSRLGGGRVDGAAAGVSRPPASTPRASANSSSSGDALSGFVPFVSELQREICEAAEAMDGSGARFCDDAFEKPDGAGYGNTRVLEDGDLLEKAAANVSVVKGTLTPERAKAMRERGRDGVDVKGGQTYEAAALSLVFHPRSPHVPTLRADVRVFAIDGGDGGAWFGGGCDLTPNYLEEGRPCTER